MFYMCNVVKTLSSPKELDENFIQSYINLVLGKNFVPELDQLSILVT
jgi:hypothetical protein